MDFSHCLTWMTFAPVVGILVLTFSGKDNVKQHRWIATLFSAISFFLALLMLYHFDSANSGMQFADKVAWIPTFHINYQVGVDGLSFPLVLLTALLCLVSIVASYGILERTKEYFVWFLLLETGMLGLFVAVDFFLFYVFWELTLVPMYFLIGIWGGPQKEYAAIKFFLFTLFGSVFILLGMLAIYFASGTGLPGSERTFDLVRLAELASQGNLKFVGWLGLLTFLGLFLGFAVKVPIFPFHTWLPLAHVEAPTPVSVILAGVLLKMGIYGFLRVSYPILPQTTQWFLPILIILAAINIIYGAFCAMAQKDLKKMVAYSSVNHMGYCLLGMAAVMGNSNAAQAGLSGAAFQMINHGLITGSLFLLVGVLYDRAHVRDIDAFGGLGSKIPVFAGLLIVQALASLGLPGLAGFVSEFLCFLGGFGGSYAGHDFKIWAGISIIGIVITAAFFLRMLKMVLMGEFNQKWEGKISDISVRELVTIVPLVLLTIVFGLFPAIALNLMGPTLDHLISLVRASL